MNLFYQAYCCCSTKEINSIFFLCRSIGVQIKKESKKKRKYFVQFLSSRKKFQQISPIRSFFLFSEFSNQLILMHDSFPTICLQE